MSVQRTFANLCGDNRLVVPEKSTLFEIHFSACKELLIWFTKVLGWRFFHGFTVVLKAKERSYFIMELFLQRSSFFKHIMISLLNSAKLSYLKLVKLSLLFRLYFG